MLDVVRRRQFAAGQHPVEAERPPLAAQGAVRLADDLTVFREADAGRPQHPRVLPAVQPDVEDDHRRRIAHRVGDQQGGVEQTQTAAQLVMHSSRVDGETALGD